MTGEVHGAAVAGDWETAIKKMDEVFSEAEKGLRDVVNLARTVGGLTDAQIGQIRGTSPSAVTQRFGARSGLLRQKMQKEWETARREWEAETHD